MSHRYLDPSVTRVLVWVFIWALTVAAHAGEQGPPVNTTIFGVSIKGYDTVAYHTENRAVKGSSTYSYTWNDAKWYFVSAENRDLFAADPDRYAPQYGGY
jgi:hypothetical protein